MIQTLCGPSTATRDGGVEEKDVARLQDVIVYALRRMAYGMLHLHNQGGDSFEADEVTSAALYATRPGSSVDAAALERLLHDIVLAQKRVNPAQDCEADSCNQTVAATLALLKQDAPSAFELNKDPDIRSALLALLDICRETAGARFRAAALGRRDRAVDEFLYTSLVAGIPDQYFETQWEGIPDNYDENGTLGRSRGLEEWVDLLLRAGGVLLAAMRMADEAAATAYGTPQPSPVSLGHRRGKVLAVSGVDLRALHEVLELTRDGNIDVYTHGGMLSAHGYPQLRAYAHLAGHVGAGKAAGLAAFPGPILFTAGGSAEQNCGDALFTSEGYPHDTESASDLAAMLQASRTMPGYTDKAFGGEITTGFGLKTLLAVAPQVADAVRGGGLRHVFLLHGCAEDWKDGGYFQKFVKLTPPDTLILDLTGGACRLSSTSLGAAGGLPRLLNTDLAAAIDFVPALASALGSVKAPLSWLLSGGTSVPALFALLNQGARNIGFGPAQAAVFTPGLWDALSHSAEVRRLGTPETDLSAMLG